MKHRTARALPLALTTLVIAGAALRTYAYLGNRSLWLDEAAIAHNVIARSFGELLAPLDRQQVAPIGFLWLEKGVVSIFGGSEYALRLVPFLASIAALALFALVARRLLASAATLFTTALFATAIPLLFYASEMKQYSLDVAVVLTLFALALPPSSARDTTARAGAISRKRLAALAIAGIVAPWLSQPSVFMLAGVGLYLLLPQLRATAAERRGAVRALAPVFALWLLGGAASVLHSLSAVTPATRAALDRFWQRGFLPASSGFTASAHWLAATTHDVFAWLFPPMVAAVVLALFVLGIAAFVRRGDGSATLILTPLAFLLFASALHLYPVGSRLLLFTTPALLLTVGAGTEWIWTIVRSAGTRRSDAADPLRQTASGRGAATPVATFVLGAALALLAMRGAMTMVEIPFYREELRPVVRYLAQERRSGDAIYVYYGASPAFEYYAARNGIPRSAYREGSCARDDWHRYLKQVDELRGNPRVWFVLSHPFNKGGIREDSLFIQYFAAIGTQTDSATAVGARLALYDLSEAHARSAPAGFAPPASGDSSSAGIGCTGAVAE